MILPLFDTFRHFLVSSCQSYEVSDLILLGIILGNPWNSLEFLVQNGL